MDRELEEIHTTRTDGSDTTSGASRSESSNASGAESELLARHSSTASVDLNTKRRSWITETDAKRSSVVSLEESQAIVVPEHDHQASAVRVPRHLPAQDNISEVDEGSDVPANGIPSHPPTRKDEEQITDSDKASMGRPRLGAMMKNPPPRENIAIPENITYSVEAEDKRHLSEEIVPSLECRADVQNTLDFVLDLTSARFKEFAIRGVNGTELILWESSPFYCRDYKLRLHVKIDEDLSISIVIMKGERDRHLPWPFDSHVVFRLINQREMSDNTKMFRSDRNGTRFRNALSRPKGNCNPPLGFPKFSKRCDLLEDGFVKNNVIRLQCYLYHKGSKLDLKPELPSIIKP